MEKENASTENVRNTDVFEFGYPNNSLFTTKSKELVAYTDGSWNNKTKTYGYGVVLIDNDVVVGKLSGKGQNQEYAKSRNVAGEVLGAQAAISWAIQNKYNSITIYHDYTGVAEWPLRHWQANKELTKNYVQYVDRCKRLIYIKFVHVPGHTGVVYNEQADQLAKKVVGV